MIVSVIGATGYTGYELIKILAGHPRFRIGHLVSETYEGKAFCEVYPYFRNICDTVIIGRNYEKVAAESEAVFLCLPHAAAQQAADFFHGKGLKVVDLSADFRLKDSRLYENVYKTKHLFPELLAKAAYGIPEIFGDEIAETDMTANPGCYPTTVIMPLFPLIKEGLIDSSYIIADAKSGATGAGRKAELSLSFCEVNEDFRAYNIFEHRHNPEMNHILERTGTKPDITFTAHLLPVNKGIETTIYAKTDRNLAELASCMKAFYKDRRFVRIYDNGHVPSLKDVVDTNFIDISLFVKDGKLIIVSCIDNLIKGSSGAAVQNLNVMCGLDETAGIL